MKTEFKIRLHNADVAKSIDELLTTKMFASTNELLNAALAIGIEKLYLEFGKRKHFSASYEIPERTDKAKLDAVERKLEELKMLEEDMFILLNSIEGLAASIYNVQRSSVKGEPITEELLDSGSLAVLPNSYNEIKEKLLQRFSKRKRKDDKQ